MANICSHKNNNKKMQIMIHTPKHSVLKGVAFKQVFDKCRRSWWFAGLEDGLL